MKLKYDELLSNVAFNCNLRHYTLGSDWSKEALKVGQVDPRLTPS